MGNFVDCWGKHGGVFSKGDRAAIEAKIREHTDAGVDPKEAARLVATEHLTDTHNQLQDIYKQSGIEPPQTTVDYLKQRSINAEVAKQKQEALDTAKSYEEQAKTAENPKVKATMEEFANKYRTQAETVSTPEYIKENIEPKFAPPEPPKAVVVTEQPPETTGVANRVLEEEAKAGKIDEIARGEGMTWQEMVDLGREELNKGANPQEIARRFDRNKRISPTDFAVLRAERERLAIESNKAAQGAGDNPNDPAAKQALVDARKAETDWIKNVVQPAKTATSDIFRGMQGEAPIDASTFEGLRRAVLDQKGREPTPREASMLEKRATLVRQAQESESKAIQRLGKAIDKQLPKTRVPTIEELQAEMSKMAEELAPCKL